MNFVLFVVQSPNRFGLLTGLPIPGNMATVSASGFWPDHAEGLGVAEDNQEHHEAYWRANFRLIVGLLIVWASVSFGAGIIFVEQLNAFQFFGVPFGFWMAHQGAIYVFVGLIFFYARRMDVLDHRHKLDTEDKADGS